MKTAKAFASAITVGTQTSGTVIAGPFLLENPAYVTLVAKAGGSGTTTPTATTIQVCAEPSATRFASLASGGALTAGTSANALSTITSPIVAGTYVQVIAGGAYGAGTSTLDVYVSGIV